MKILIEKDYYQGDKTLNVPEHSGVNLEITFDEMKFLISNCNMEDHDLSIDTKSEIEQTIRSICKKIREEL